MAFHPSSSFAQTLFLSPCLISSLPRALGIEPTTAASPQPLASLAAIFSGVEALRLVTAKGRSIPHSSRVDLASPFKATMDRGLMPR